MKESFWGIFIVGVGVLMIFFIYFFQSLTNTDEHNYALLKETVEAAMYDSIDLAAYKANGDIKIVGEKFAESFVRRFADNANLSRTYKVEIMDISETPPKVSVRLSSSESTNLTGEIITFDVTNTLDAILETPY